MFVCWGLRTKLRWVLRFWNVLCQCVFYSRQEHFVFSLPHRTFFRKTKLNSFSFCQVVWGRRCGGHHFWVDVDLTPRRKILSNLLIENAVLRLFWFPINLIFENEICPIALSRFPIFSDKGSSIWKSVEIWTNYWGWGRRLRYRNFDVKKSCSTFLLCDGTT